MKSIVLIGMMGAGKTSVGEILAQKLNISFFDIDKIIEDSQNLSISDIFALKGESYFRDIEKNTIQQIINSQNIPCVISTGGGAFENAITRNLLLEKTITIYLQTSPDIIFNRIKTDNTRPLLKNNMTVEKISNIIEQRQNNYSLANYTILTDNKSLEDIAQEILRCVN